MIQSYPVKGVFQSDHALNLVGNDHCFQHIANRQRRLTVGDAFLRQVISNGEDGTEVVRWMAPFGGKPGVVVVQPADYAADVPGGFARIEAIRGTWHSCTERYYRAFDDRAEVFRAFGETQGQQTTAQRVDQAIARGVQRLGGFGLEGEDVVGDVLQDCVVIGAVVQVDVGAHGGSPVRGNEWLGLPQGLGWFMVRGVWFLCVVSEGSPSP